MNRDFANHSIYIQGNLDRLRRIWLNLLNWLLSITGTQHSTDGRLIGPDRKDILVLSMFNSRKLIDEFLLIKVLTKCSY